MCVNVLPACMSFVFGVHKGQKRTLITDKYGPVEKNVVLQSCVMVVGFCGWMKDGWMDD